MVNSTGKEYLSFLIKYLASFSLEDAYALSEAKAEAAKAIIEFVKTPDLFQVLDHLLFNLILRGWF